MAVNRVSSGLDPMIRHIHCLLRGTPFRIFLILWLILFIILSGAVSYLQIFSIKKNAEYAERNAEKAAALLSFQLNSALYKQNENELKTYFTNLAKSEKSLVIVVVRSKTNNKSFTCINDRYLHTIEKYKLQNFLNNNFASGISREKELIIVHQPVVKGDNTIGWINAAFDINGTEGVSNTSNYAFSLLFSGVISLVITFVMISMGRNNNESSPVAETAYRAAGDEPDLSRLNQTVKALSAAFRKTKEELADSHIYTSAIIQAMESALFVIGRDKIIKIVNKSACNLLGYRQEELVGQDLTQFLHEDQAAGISIQNLIDKGSLRKIPADFIKRDNQTVSVSFSGSVIHHDSNEIQDIICIAEDITERKDAEAAIIKAHDELEIRVAERTFELEEINKALKAENKERLETEKKLTNMLEEKEVLLKEIHHRVKNNLQIISSLLQLNTTKIKDKESLEVFKASQMRIKSIAMVHERLYQSKDLGFIDINDYLRVLTKDLFTLFGGKTAGIKLNTNVIDVHLNIDKTISLGLILNELVTNSIKYAFPDNREGEINIDIRKNEENEYKLFYRDNGIGFASDNVTEQNTLGLRLIRSLTRQLDGSLEIKNEGGVQYVISFKED